MLRKIALGLSLIVLLVIAGCTSANTSTGESPIVRLSQDIIDNAVAECQDKTSWGINLAIVRTNYVAGATLEAAIVLHNGDDARRAITLRYKPIKEPKVTTEGVTYYPAPIKASGWVTIGTPEITMDKMQTEVVTIQLTVPEDYKIDSKHWEFGIEADGQSILEYDQQLTEVITDVGETELYVTLHQPLFQNNILSVVVSSSIDELPYVTKYNPSDRTLCLDGLKESEEREMTITYEYTPMVSIAYTQRWLITML